MNPRSFIKNVFLGSFAPRAARLGTSGLYIPILLAWPRSKVPATRTELRPKPECSPSAEIGIVTRKPQLSLLTESGDITQKWIRRWLQQVLWSMRLQDYVSALTRIPCDEASQTITRILVVEDFAPFRVFISSFLAQDPDLQIVWESADGTEAVRWARELSPDLILMDTGLPGVLNGIEVAREIGQSISESKIAFLHMEISAEVVQSTLELDALGQVPES